MKVRGAFALFITVFAAVFFSPINASPNDGFPPPASPRSHYVPGELLVKYKPRIAASAITSSLLQSSVEIKRSYAGIGVHHLKLPAKMSVDEAVRTFTSDPSVEYAEPNYVRHVTSTIPDDTFFPNLWGLHNTGQSVNGTEGTPGDDIHAPEAWDIAKGNRAVVIAVIDSGVDYNHPDLAGNISSDLRYDFVNGDSYPMDANDHGTHVAGTIAAVGNNGAGVTGVCWTAAIMPLRAGDAFGTLRVSDIVSAINYAINNGARIINSSYRGYDFSQAEYDAISSARNAGILLVAAAGNEANNNDDDMKRSYPASYELDNIIAVAATDQNDNLAHFSNYGAGSVHVAAPGVNIYSTKPARRTLWSTNFDSGSMSDWTTGGTNNTWGLSTLRHYSGSYSLAVNPAGNYLNSSNSWARAPVLNLSASLGSKLNFVFTGKSESDYDLFHVETSTDGNTWTGQDIYVTDRSGSYVDTYANGISGNGSGQWYGAAVDLGGYDGKNTVFVRFRFTSDNSINYLGWFIDDIRVTDASSTYSGAEYQYLSGTSMAAPHVAGIAALIWGFKPGLTYAQVKNIILSSVDARSSLAGKTVTGGRVNALSALYHVAPQTPGSLAASVSPSGAITFTWTDSSLNESGFRIERKTDGGTYALISTAYKNSTTYSDTGLSAATTYCYRIASFNDGGNSDYSNEVCATTPGSGGGGSGGGGCFIATAAFGSPLEPHVQILRDFRDRYLLRHEAGKRFVGAYYRISPPLAGIISKSDTLRSIVRWCLMPCVGAAYLTVHHGPMLTLAVFTVLVLFMISLLLLFRVRSRRLIRY